MANFLPPFRGNFNSPQFVRWLEELYQKITRAAAIAWLQLDFTASSIGDIATRTHSLTTSRDADDHTQYHTDARGDARYPLKNAAITGATKTKITYDAKGLVTAGSDATTADIADSANRRYVTDANLVVIGNTSGTNTGDQDLSGYVAKTYGTNTVTNDIDGIQLINNDAAVPTSITLTDSGVIVASGAGAIIADATSFTLYGNEVGLTSDNTLTLTGTTGIDATAPYLKFNGTQVMAADYSNAGTAPTWNQNTTGSAAKLTTGRTIGLTGPITWTSPLFDGSGNVTAAATVTTQTGAGSTFVMDTSPTLVTPNIGAATGASLAVTGSLTTGATIVSNVSTTRNQVDATATASGATQFDINAMTGDGSSGSAVRIGRTVNTSARVELAVLLGNNTATQNASIAGNGDSYINANNGNLAVGSTTATYKLSVSGGDIATLTAGNGIRIKTGSNAKMGSGTLSGGTATISNTSVTANSYIVLSGTGGGVLANIGAIYEDKPSRSTGTSFVVKSLNVLDSSTFIYFIIEPS